jgi:hypothetical protein
LTATVVGLIAVSVSSSWIVHYQSLLERLQMDSIGPRTSRVTWGCHRYRSSLISYTLPALAIATHPSSNSTIMPNSQQSRSFLSQPARPTILTHYLFTRTLSCSRWNPTEHRLVRSLAMARHEATATTNHIFACMGGPGSWKTSTSNFNCAAISVHIILTFVHIDTSGESSLVHRCLFYSSFPSSFRSFPIGGFMCEPCEALAVTRRKLGAYGPTRGNWKQRRKHRRVLVRSPTPKCSRRGRAGPGRRHVHTHRFMPKTQ